MLSATDLSFFLGCNHATWLDLEVVNGKIKTPTPFYDPSLEALKIKGQEFEDNVIKELEQQGKSIARISKDYKKISVEETINAMKNGVDVIYQARLELNDWVGWADFLLKTDKPGKFGNWSYEVMDTKFARHTKAGSILQICLYSDMLTQLQEVQPENMYIRTPEGGQTYRVDDYISYFRLMQRRIKAFIGNTEEVTYPNPVEQCAICKWFFDCNARRRKDDHLGFVAGMGMSQIKEVNKQNITTLQSMAELPVPLTFVPSKGNISTYNKLREQARLQLQARTEMRNVYEMLPLLEDFGLYKLPAPSDGDFFFDFEGDPFVGSAGREYIFGWVHKHAYHILWATTDLEEKEAFEKFIDTVMHAWKEYPDMHIYHYSAYEPSALKRLMGRYATREDEVDRLLRANIFIDLHGIVKHSLRAGVEAYSLKEMEKMHNFQRAVELKLVRPHKAKYELLLESGDLEAVSEETKQVVEDYNKDDCLSTESLRDWLEKLRKELIEKGNKIERPDLGEGDPGENITEHQQRIQPLFDGLMNGLPFERSERNNEQEAKFLLANMLDWYRREDKSFWWEYYRLRDLADDELLNERDAISGLIFNGKIENVKKSQIHYYNFPEQESELKTGNKSIKYKNKTVGDIYSLDTKNRILGIRKNAKFNEIHPTHVIYKKFIESDEKEEAIIRLAEWVIANGIDGEGEYRAARELLLKTPPRIISAIEKSGNAQEKAVKWVMELNNSVLPVQGPPGTGKSHTAARMITSLIRSGKKIGITSLSHKVITGLLHKVVAASIEEGSSIRIIQKSKDVNSSNPNWIVTDDYGDITDAITANVNIVAGTSFMWSREEFSYAVDYLFVDEAGQLSLIDTMALSHAGNNLVLLGDPQQLQQPQKGHHPEGTEASALSHILGVHQTIPEEHGVFLDKTWRMHPEICSYISEMFYENRLEPMPGNSKQKLIGSTRYSKPGIYIEPVSHAGNSNQSIEEAEVVQRIIHELLNNNIFYIDHHGKEQKLNNDSIKVITPYNAQVNALTTKMPEIQIGTVDKFQGQEAQVIIFSMATSTPEDAPRGMEFLYSLNRLNVAVSRARTVFILVASPALFEPGCRSPQQIKLANALCRLVERSHP